MKDNQIIIDVKDGKVKMHPRKNTAAMEFIEIFCTCILGAMNQIVSNCPTAQQAAAKAALYDAFNISASNLLTMFAPEIEARGDLTTEAILAMEDQILDEGLRNMSKVRRAD